MRRRARPLFLRTAGWVLLVFALVYMAVALAGNVRYYGQCQCVLLLFIPVKTSLLASRYG